MDINTHGKSAGEALISLLMAYDVDTIFGIPGVHNVELYRGLKQSNIRHVLPRHEQGAGFMADGYARATGKPGVCFTITGPGLTNIMTPIGQAYSDSVPVLVISSTLDLKDLGQNAGRLHEMQNQRNAAATVTGMARIATAPRNIPELVAKALSGFASARPRPAYIEIPMDVLKMPAGDGWSSRALASRMRADPAAIEEAVQLLRKAKRPMLILGGGALDCTGAATRIAESLNAMVHTTVAGKGVIPEDHPLNLGALMPQARTHELLAQADVLLVAGSELSETDFWIERIELPGRLIRIDLDPHALSGRYPAQVAIQADARQALEALAQNLAGGAANSAGNPAAAMDALREAIQDSEDEPARQLRPVIETLRKSLPRETLVATDMTLIAYQANEQFPVYQPRSWLHPVGFGTLGYALPAAVGAKIGAPERPVAALLGDYGFQFTLPELGVAAELKLPIPVLMWNNNRLGAIQADMLSKGIEPTAVTMRNPDFQLMAKAWGCGAEQPANLTALGEAVERALQADSPTLIEMTSAMADAG